jgi:hypothetical protein
MKAANDNPSAGIPLYPDEREIALLVLGPKRMKDWDSIAAIEERHGLPKIDPQYGGRYWPAVLRFYNVRNGLDAATNTAIDTRQRVRVVPFAPDGEETFDAEKAASVRHRQ